MRRLLLISIVTASVSGVALAAGVGGKLYVKARNTRLYQRSTPGSPVLKVLQPGAEVIWKGADPAAKQWHKVELPGGATGVVFQSNLSPKPPSTELIASKGGVEVDAQAFASSGAATKAVSPGAFALGKERSADALADLVAAEALAQQVSLGEVGEHARTVGLFPVVGPGASAAAATPGKKKGKK